MVVSDIMHKDRFGGEISRNGIDTLSGKGRSELSCYGDIIFVHHCGI